jgi:hypothetical protein
MKQDRTQQNLVQQDQSSSKLLGCKVTFENVPEGLQAWFNVRWLRSLDLARDFELHIQTSTQTGTQPRAAKNAHVHNRALLNLFEQQLEVVTLRSATGRSATGQVRTSAPELVRVTAQPSDVYVDSDPVWLELADKHATLTLPAGQDIDADAAQAGVWQGSMSPYPLVTCLQEALRAAGMYPVHGACACNPQGQTALLLGASGTGKTTTLLRALQAGWSPVAEDVVWLEADTGSTYSLEKGLRVFEDTLAQLDARLAERTWGKLVMGKALLPYRDLATYYGGTQIQGTSLSHVVQLVRTKSTGKQMSTWQPLDKRQLAVALWQGLGMPLTTTLRQQLAEFVPQWLEVVQGWQLNLGSDVAETLRRGVPKS